MGDPDSVVAAKAPTESKLILYMLPRVRTLGEESRRVSEFVLSSFFFFFFWKNVSGSKFIGFYKLIFSKFLWENKIKIIFSK